MGRLGDLTDEEYSEAIRIMDESETIEEAYELITQNYNISPLGIINIHVDGKVDAIFSKGLAIDIDGEAYYNSSEEVISRSFTVDYGSKVSLFQHENEESLAKAMNYMELSTITVRYS